jgi:hypothetical protein
MDQAQSDTEPVSSMPLNEPFSHRGPWTSRVKQVFQRPLIVTLRLLLFSGRRKWAKFWRNRAGSPPHWVKDLLDIFSWINLLPTFCVMTLAPRHFFRRTPTILTYGSTFYKTPIKFLVSAIPLTIGFIAWMYRSGLVLFLHNGLDLAIHAIGNGKCCEDALLNVASAALKALRWLKSAPDIHVVSAVLMGIPVWVPLVSCLVALVLLLPRLFNAVGTRTILPLLVSVDPKTYLRIRVRDYSWTLLYFAVYFVVAFPFCLLVLYGIYHELCGQARASWALGRSDYGGWEHNRLWRQV